MKLTTCKLWFNQNEHFFRILCLSNEIHLNFITAVQRTFYKLQGKNNEKLFADSIANMRKQRHKYN